MISGQKARDPVRNKDLPIGIFDSGVGGLTVLKEVLTGLPHESTLYLGDTARVPYGIRSPETIIRYSFENTRFLSSKGIKMLVVACNTASSVALGHIKDSVQIPVVGVIDPGAKAAVSYTRNRKIGVIGTEGTIRSNAYTNAIKALDPDIEVVSLPCPLFVPLVEEGWTDNAVTEMIAETYLSAIRQEEIDTLVLGCTHYPLLKNVLSRVMGSTVRLVDSAIETAKEVRNILDMLSLLKTGEAVPSHTFYVTDSPERFINVGEKFLHQKILHIEKIALQKEN